MAFEVAYESTVTVVILTVFLVMRKLVTLTSLLTIYRSFLSRK